MEKTVIVLLHGFASSGQSTKAHFFRESFSQRVGVTFAAIDFNPTPADFCHTTATGMIDRLRQYVLDRGLQQMHLIGSSFGGLIAAHYAYRFGGVGKMLLLAPALKPVFGWVSGEQVAEWKAAGVMPVYHFGFERELPLAYQLYEDAQRYQHFVPPPVPTLIVHGTHDEIVPVAHSRAYAAQWPDHVRLVEVDAGHELNGHLEFIWQEALPFLLAGG